MKVKVFSAVIIALALFSSCVKDVVGQDYGKDNQIQILDENGEEVNHVYISRWEMPVCYSIVGGLGENYLIEVEDTDVVSCHVNSKIVDSFCFIPYLVEPAELYVSGIAFGSTTISITDVDADQTIYLHVDVMDGYIAASIVQSDVDGYEENMLLAFSISESNEYRILSQSGKEYTTVEVGTYKFGEPGKTGWELTLSCGDSETAWCITDADNNRHGYANYIPDVSQGLGLPYSVTTKFEFQEHYPDRFCFTDTANPERSFISGPADVVVAYPLK